MILNPCFKDWMHLHTINSYPAEFPESVVLGSSAKPSLGCQLGSTGLVWQKIQESLTSNQGCWYSFNQGCKLYLFWGAKISDNNHYGVIYGTCVPDIWISLAQASPW